MRKTALFTLIVLAVLVLLSAGFSDQTLTVTLDSPPNSSEKKPESELRLKHETLGATREGSGKQYYAQVQAPKDSSKKDVPIGRVGIVTVSKAHIKSTSSTRGRTLFTSPKDTYLAIVGERGSWYGVLMIDSSVGWIEKKKVKLLDYRVLSQSLKASGAGSRIVQTALKYLGIRYKWGGYSFGGLDCSGFVKAVFASHKIHLPRTSRAQLLVGTPVGFSQLQPGDRLYFACKGGQVDHAGIYMGNGLFVHSSASRGGVAIDSIANRFYLYSLVAARRS